MTSVRLIIGHALLFVFGFAITLASADPVWHSYLYPPHTPATPSPPPSFARDKFLQDFSYAGYASGERDLPTSPEADLLDVSDFGADPSGLTDSTAALQKALDTAAQRAKDLLAKINARTGVSDGTARHVVVYMPPGTYAVRPPAPGQPALRLQGSNVILRGAGTGLTFILNKAPTLRGQAVIAVRPKAVASWFKEQTDATPLARDLEGPTLNIPVTDTRPFRPGDFVLICADANDAWAHDHQETAWLGRQKQLGGIRYHRQVLEIDHENGLLRIDAPTRHLLRLSHQARVVRHSGMLQEIGLEHFSIGNLEPPDASGWEFLDFRDPRKPAFTVHDSWAISLTQVLDGWIRSVRSFAGPDNPRGSHLLSNGILLNQCRRVTISDCVFQRPFYGGGGGNGYMFRLNASNDCLLRDCTAAFSRHGFSLAFMPTSGNVFLRCTDRDTGIQAAGSRTTNGKGSDHHMFFSHSNLFDNCLAENSWFEARDRFSRELSSPHNITAAHTVFWNTRGEGENGFPYVVWSQQAFWGYVIGTSGSVQAVRLDGNHPERRSIFDPEDHAEGIGQGATLRPVSLYTEQLQRRLKRENGKPSDH